MENFDLEKIVRPFVDDVNTALKGFEGKAATLESVVHELREEQASIKRQALFNGGAAPEGKSKATAEEKQALVDYVKGVNSLTGEAGGFGVPQSVSDDVLATILKQSPVRQFADVRTIDNPRHRILVNVRGTGSGWVGETQTRAGTDTPELEAIEPPVGTIYSLASLSEEIIDDFAQDVEQWLIGDIAEHLAEQESQAFISGDGTNKPSGFLSGTPTTSGDATRDFGDLQFIATGSANSLGTDLPDKLLAMVFALRAGYRQTGEAAWMASTAVVQALTELKDNEDRPLYIPSYREGVPGTLLGFPMAEAEHMPAVATGTFPMAFGNFRRGYTITDLRGLTILRDPYSVKGSVQIYARKRVGGAVRDSNAIKLLRCST